MEEVELPDLEQEEDTLVALEAVTLDIDSLLTDIRENGGVSRPMVEKARHILPEDTNYNYYSNTPSQSQLKVTMESIDLKTALLIAGAVAAVAVLAVKIFQYIKKSREKIEYNVKKLTGHVEAAERCFKVCDKITSKLNSDAKGEVEAAVKQLNDDYKTKVSAFYNPFLKDIVTNGKVSHVIADAHRVAKPLFDKVEASVTLLEKLVDSKDTTVSESQLIDPKDMSLPDALKAIANYSSENASSAMSEIAEGVNNMRALKLDFIDDMEDVFDKNKKHTGENSKVYGAGFPSIDGLEKRVVRIEQKVTKDKDLEAERRAEINKVTNSLRSGLQQLMVFTRICGMASSGSRQFWMAMEKFAATKLKRVAAIAVADDDAEVKKALEQASKIKP